MKPISSPAGWHGHDPIHGGPAPEAAIHTSLARAPLPNYGALIERMDDLLAAFDNVSGWRPSNDMVGPGPSKRRATAQVSQPQPRAGRRAGEPDTSACSADSTLHNRA
jgi:hypothetical protein